MQSFFTRFYSLVLPVLDPPILIERFFLDAHFARKSTIKSEHSPIWRNKDMSYHILHNIAISNTTFSSTILTICQECAPIFQWQTLTTICVRHLPSGESRIIFLPEWSSICQYPPKISAINVNKQSRAGLLLAHPVSYILKIQKTYGTFWKPPFQNQPKSVRLSESGSGSATWVTSVV